MKRNRLLRISTIIADAIVAFGILATFFIDPEKQTGLLQFAIAIIIVAFILSLFNIIYPFLREGTIKPVRVIIFTILNLYHLVASLGIIFFLIQLEETKGQSQKDFEADMRAYSQRINKRLQGNWINTLDTSRVLQFNDSILLIKDNCRKHIDTLNYTVTTISCDMKLESSSCSQTNNLIKAYLKEVTKKGYDYACNEIETCSDSLLAYYTWDCKKETYKKLFLYPKTSN